MLANTITHAWEKLVKKLDINVPLHGCRHTHASMLLGAGVSIKTISERLGHSSASLTLDVYSHVIKGQQEQAAVKFDELVNYHPEK
jgi:integrase